MSGLASEHGSDTDSNNLSFGSAEFTFIVDDNDDNEMSPKFDEIARLGKMEADMEGVAKRLDEAEDRQEEFQRDTKTQSSHVPFKKKEEFSIKKKRMAEDRLKKAKNMRYAPQNQF